MFNLTGYIEFLALFGQARCETKQFSIRLLAVGRRFIQETQGAAEL